MIEGQWWFIRDYEVIPKKEAQPSPQSLSKNSPKKLFGQDLLEGGQVTWKKYGKRRIFPFQLSKKRHLNGHKKRFGYVRLIFKTKLGYFMSFDGYSYSHSYSY